MTQVTAKTIGHVEVQDGWGEEIGFMRYKPVFHVYDWSEHFDSGAIVGEFDTRDEALTFPSFRWTFWRGISP